MTIATIIAILAGTAAAAIAAAATPRPQAKPVRARNKRR
jgi:hypothetical protein